MYPMIIIDKTFQCLLAFPLDQFSSIAHFDFVSQVLYCGWMKSCTVDAWNHENPGPSITFYRNPGTYPAWCRISQPSTVWPIARTLNLTTQFQRSHDAAVCLHMLSGVVQCSSTNAPSTSLSCFFSMNADSRLSQTCAWGKHISHISNNINQKQSKTTSLVMMSCHISMLDA